MVPGACRRWWLVVVLLAGGIASALSTPAVQAATSTNQEQAVAAALAAEAPGGKDAFVFEEPAVLAPDESGPEPGTEDDGCSPAPDGRELPRVAIIIDDMGYHQGLGSALLALEMNLTYSFLPHAPFTRDQGEQARQQGREILVHMPMEALDPAWDPGPGALYLADPLAEVAQKVAQNLALVPHAVGINNHMGSRYTGDHAAMRQFFKLLSGQDLLFIDSGTSSSSVAMETARAMGFKASRRHVFLDNVKTQEDVCRQLKQLVKEANERGWAIGIGHPNEATLIALTRCRDMLSRQVRLVGVSELVR